MAGVTDGGFKITADICRAVSTTRGNVQVSDVQNWSCQNRPRDVLRCLPGWPDWWHFMFVAFSIPLNQKPQGKEHPRRMIFTTRWSITTSAPWHYLDVYGHFSDQIVFDLVDYNPIVPQEADKAASTIPTHDWIIQIKSIQKQKDCFFARQC